MKLKNGISAPSALLSTVSYSSGTPSSGSPACYFLSLLFLCFLSPFLSLPSFSLIPLFLISLPFLFHALCSGCFFVWYAFLIRTCIVFSKLQSQPCCQMLCQEEDQGLRDPNVGLPQEEKDCAQDHVQTQDADIAGDRRQGRGVWVRAAGNWRSRSCCDSPSGKRRECCEDFSRASKLVLWRGRCLIVSASFLRTQHQGTFPSKQL